MERNMADNTNIKVFSSFSYTISVGLQD